MSFNVILQLTLEVECFLADGTFPILDPFVDHLMLGPCRGSPEGLFATKPALVLLLPGVLGHVHSQVVLRVAGELAVRTGERVRRRLVRDFLVQVVTTSGQILRVANVALEGKNAGVPKDVVFESDFCFITLSTFLTDEISCLAVLDHMSIHSFFAGTCEITMIAFKSSVQIVDCLPVREKELFHKKSLLTSWYCTGKQFFVLPLVLFHVLGKELTLDRGFT